MVGVSGATCVSRWSDMMPCRRDSTTPTDGGRGVPLHRSVVRGRCGLFGYRASAAPFVSLTTRPSAPLAPPHCSTSAPRTRERHTCRYHWSRHHAGHIQRGPCDGGETRSECGETQDLTRAAE
eukprot:3183776-Prymnesium_polylepis.1